MTRDAIMNELKARGYHVRPSDTMKNGVDLHGIVIGDGPVCPCIYTENYKYASDMDAVISEIIKIYEQSQKQYVINDTKSLLTWDYAKEHLQLCIQHQSSEDLVKREFLDLEEYVRVLIEDFGSFKVLPEHLEVFGIDENQLFQAALECTKPGFIVRRMDSFLHSLKERLGISQEDVDLIPPNLNMFVFTHKSGAYGASILTNLDQLSELSERFQKDLLLLPSSIHEIIAVLIDDSVDISYFDTMIREINEYELSPLDVLSNHAYLFSRETKQLSFLKGPSFTR